MWQKFGVNCSNCFQTDHQGRFSSNTYSYLFRPWPWSCDRNLEWLLKLHFQTDHQGALSLSLHTVICSGLRSCDRKSPVPLSRSAPPSACVYHWLNSYEWPFERGKMDPQESRTKCSNSKSITPICKMSTPWESQDFDEQVHIYIIVRLKKWGRTSKLEMYIWFQICHSNIYIEINGADLTLHSRVLFKQILVTQKL